MILNLICLLFWERRETEKKMVCAIDTFAQTGHIQSDIDPDTCVISSLFRDRTTLLIYGVTNNSVCVCVSLLPPACLPACLPVCLSLSLSSACLSVCLSLSPYIYIYQNPAGFQILLIEIKIVISAGRILNHASTYRSFYFYREKSQFGWLLK